MYAISSDIPPPQSRSGEDSKSSALRKLEVNQSVFFPGIKTATGLMRNVKQKPEYADRVFIQAEREEDLPIPEGSPKGTKAQKVRGIRVWRTK